MGHISDKTSGNFLVVESNGAIAAVPDRPSQKTGRVYKAAAAEAVTTSQTLYTVTVGKVLYVTSITFNGFNSSTVNPGRLQIRDGTTVKQGVIVPAAGVGSVAASVQAMLTGESFPEPLQFATSFNTNIVTGTWTYSIDFVGYEE